MESNEAIKIKEVLSRNRASKSLISYLRKEDDKVMRTEVEKLEGYKDDLKESYSHYEVIQLFKELRAVGCGIFRKGRRGGKTRLEWIIDTREFLQAALSETMSPEQQTQRSPNSGTVSALTSDPAARTKTPVLAHHFNLRADFMM